MMNANDSILTKTLISFTALNVNTIYALSAETNTFLKLKTSSKAKVIVAPLNNRLRTKPIKNSSK